MPHGTFRPRLEVEGLEQRLVLSIHPLSSLPLLNSLPGAPAALYLDFDGDFQANWGGHLNITTPAYDSDGDATSFSDYELTSINYIWQSVAEDYSPFNINVTTVAPPSLDNGVALKVAIGGDGAWGGGGIGGTAAVNSFTTPLPNVAFVFSKNLSNGSPSATAECASHESGHSFGLLHQSRYDASGNLVASYYTGPMDGTAPIMGQSFGKRGLWWYGTPEYSGGTFYQNDMDVIASGTNGFGYRSDNNGTAASATPLTASGNQVSASGIVARMTDLDYFSFTTEAGQISLSVQVPQYVNDLIPRLELRSASGSLLATAAGDMSFGATNMNATISATVGAGTYYLVVASNGPSPNSTPTSYGFNVGSYTVTGTIVDGGTITVNPPSGLAAQAISATQVNLSWTNNAAGATGYLIDRSADGVTWIQIASRNASGAMYSDTSVASGMTYFYQVRAVIGSSVSSPSNPASVTLVPAAPSGLAASAASTSQINLSWSDVAGETGFKLERSTDGANWTQIATTASGVTSYQDTSLAAGSTYYYRVRAYNSAGNSVYSSQASATTPVTASVPAVPGSLTASAVAANEINVTWSDVAGETGYKLERSTDGVNFTQIATTAAGDTNYQDTGLAAATTYHYRVRACNSLGDSAYSGVAQAATPAATAPLPPSNLSAVQVSSTQVNLSWSDNSLTETGFVIQRQSNNGKWTTIAQVGADVTTFSDTTPSARKTYKYRVYAYNTAGNSAYSNVAQPSSATAASLAEIEVLELPVKAAANLLEGRLPSDQAVDQVLLLWAEHGFFGD